MKCKLDVTRIERCFICPAKCCQFLDWYHDNRDWYDAEVNGYVERYPEKYEKEYVLMETRKKTTPTQKMVAVIDGDTIDAIIPKSSLIASSDADKYKGKRIIELTGKEYEVVVSISLKQKGLREVAAKRGNKK
jgi:hypothetical protein